MSGGLALSERFYRTVVGPLLAAAGPDLRYAAARLGDGSEVLGFDDAMSADHNYGPTLQILLPAESFAALAPRLMAALDAGLPQSFEGWTIRFPSFGRPIGREGWLTSNHGVELLTAEALVRIQLGVGLDPPTPVEWFAFPEQRLLTLTAGAVFRDDAGILAVLRERLAWYPRDVWLARLAAQWSRIGEERAFVGRTGERGDDLGSRLVTTRLVHDLMRLAFLVERRYAPYSKWFGAAFARLPLAPQLAPLLQQALETGEWRQREGAIAEAARRLGALQRERGIPGARPPRIHAYYERPFHVINADEIADGLRRAIADPEIRALPVGAVDQFADATPVLTRAPLAHALIGAIADQSGRSS